MKNLSETAQLLINTITRTLKSVVLGAGYATLVVRSVSEDVEGGRTIINFSGCTKYQRGKIVESLRKKESVEGFSEAELQEIANLNSTYSFPTEWLQRDNAPFVPSAGETVKALFVEKYSDNQNTTILVVDSIKPMGAASMAKATSLDDIFGGVDVEEGSDEKTEADAIADEVNG